MNEILKKGETLSSEFNRCMVTLEDDNNLVLRNATNLEKKWTSETQRQEKDAHLLLSSFGALILFNSTTEWKYMNPTVIEKGFLKEYEGPFELVMQDDCNLVLYRKNKIPYWSTETHVR